MKLYKTLTTSVEAVEGYDFHLTARAYALPHEHDGLKARAVSYIDDNPVAAALEREHESVKNHALFEGGRGMKSPERCSLTART